MTSGREKRARKLATTLMYAACESDDGIEYGQVIAAILAFADAERREGAREALERMAEECCRAALRPEGNAGSLELVGMLDAEALRLTPNHQAPLNGSGERSEYDRGHSDAMESPFVQGMRDVLEQHGLLGAPLDRAMHERMLSNPVSQPQPLSNDGRVALGSEPSLLDEAEARGIEIGRAAERRDVVAWLRVAPRARGILIHINSSQDIARLADDIESGAHLDAKEKSE
jgi:hypothetical protein